MIAGWSAGIRMMQSHLRMKKAALTEAQRKIRGATLAPVVDLKKTRDEETPVPMPPPPSLSPPPRPTYGGQKSVSWVLFPVLFRTLRIIHINGVKVNSCLALFAL